jgi:hypothetical protein
MSAFAALLPDSRRLHLRHGPIDLILEAWGDAREVAAAYGQATAAFGDVLPTLARELPLLRTPISASESPSPNSVPSPLAGEGQGEGALEVVPAIHETVGVEQPLTLTLSREGRGDSFFRPPTPRQGRMRWAPAGPVARRMWAACRPHRARFITPMAAVAGAVADHMLAAMLDGCDLARAYVNDGGDIAVHLAPGESLTCGVVGNLRAPALDGTIILTADMPVRGIATSGAATKGTGGRSFSLGIADAATVLAASAAAADAAATMIANAVDLARHPAIRRAPAADIDADSDLGERPVTVEVGPLAPNDIEAALDAGYREAEHMRRRGLIYGAVLMLRGRHRVCGPLAALPRAA